MYLSIKNKIRNYLLNKKLSKLNRNKEFKSLNSAQSVVVLFDASSDSDILIIKIFLKYLLNRSLDVYMLGYVNDNKFQSIHLSTIHINYYNNKNLNYLGIPNSSILSKFFGKKCDILINLSLTYCFPNRYLSLISDSPYKVGVSNDLNKKYYDLMIKIKVNSLDFFITNLKHYLELIEKNNEK